MIVNSNIGKLYTTAEASGLFYLDTTKTATISGIKVKNVKVKSKRVIYCRKKKEDVT